MTQLDKMAKSLLADSSIQIAVGALQALQADPNLTKDEQGEVNSALSDLGHASVQTSALLRRLRPNHVAVGSHAEIISAIQGQHPGAHITVVE